MAGIAGVVNIASALYPAIPGRMDVLRDVVPMHLIRASQTATVLIGFSLILLADGLRKRRYRAMQCTIALLIASSILHLGKGLDFEESTADVLFAVLLITGRGAFNVRGRAPVPHHIAQRVLTFGLIYYCYVLAGSLILRRVIRPAPTLITASSEPFHLLVDASQFHYTTAQAQWFGRSMIVFASLAALYAIVQIIRPFIPVSSATLDEFQHVKRLVRQYGSDTLSYFALQDGRSYFFDASGEAFLSYRLWGSVALVGADPIGRPDRIAPLVRSFLEFAGANGMEACFLGVDGRFAPTYDSVGYRLLKIGEEAIIDLTTFDAASLKRKVRRAARHIEELGIEATRYRAGEVPPEVRSQLEVISKDWLEAKGGQQGFSMTLGRLPRPDDSECELLVASRGDEVWGYLSLVPAQAGSAWSLDAMRRRADSPNGLTEFLVIRAAELYRAEGNAALSLNFATLSNTKDDIDSRVVEGARHFLWEQLSSVYQLKTLYQFNEKFQPIWRSRYLAYSDLLKIPKLAVAIAQTEAPLQLPVPVLRREP
jgi:phosphatidylglycerol lysyltransferase